MKDNNNRAKEIITKNIDWPINVSSTPQLISINAALKSMEEHTSEAIKDKDKTIESLQSSLLDVAQKSCAKIKEQKATLERMAEILGTVLNLNRSPIKREFKNELVWRAEILLSEYNKTKGL